MPLTLKNIMKKLISPLLFLLIVLGACDSEPKYTAAERQQACTEYSTEFYQSHDAGDYDSEEAFRAAAMSYQSRKLKENGYDD